VWVFCCFVGRTGVAIDVGDGRIIIRGRSSSRNSTKTPAMKRKKKNKEKKNKQKQVKEGRKECNKRVEFFVLVSSVCCCKKQNSLQ
jgi:glycerol-3-phosphate dehydrogenase